MPFKPIVQGLAAIWLVAFAMSFMSLRGADPDEELAGSLSRIVVFLTWQVIAFAIAAAGTLTARHAVARGQLNVKLIGYTPLAISVFVIAAFVAVMAIRFLLVPMLESLGLL